MSELLNNEHHIYGIYASVPPPLKNNCIEHFSQRGPMPGTSNRNCSKGYGCRDWENCGDCPSYRCDFDIDKCYEPGTQGQHCNKDYHCEDGFRCNDENHCTNKKMRKKKS
jgi:hypothetical protein